MERKVRRLSTGSAPIASTAQSASDSVDQRIQTRSIRRLSQDSVPSTVGLPQQLDVTHDVNIIEDDSYQSDSSVASDGHLEIDFGSLFSGFGIYLGENLQHGSRSTADRGRRSFGYEPRGVMRILYDAFRQNLPVEEARVIMMDEEGIFDNMTATALVSPHVLLDHISIRRIGSRAEASSIGHCPICLVEYKKRMLVRVLPGCGHYIHKTCFDKWVWKSPRYACPLDNIEIKIDCLENACFGPDQVDGCEMSPDEMMQALREM